MPRKVEREAGFEPAYQPWKGCTLPLSYPRTASRSDDGLFEKSVLARVRSENLQCLLAIDVHRASRWYFETLRHQAVA